MESTKPKLRPPVKWHGGKYYLCDDIIRRFPQHNTYVEPFGGAASVLLNKPPAAVEVYNDVDGRITNLFEVLRDHGEEFLRRITLTPYSEREFNDLKTGELWCQSDKIERARRDFVCWRLSLGGRGESFSFTAHRVRRGMADVVSGYLSAIDEQLPRIIDRIRGVQIVCRPALEVISYWDGDETLFYCDPPYVHETRHENSRDVYGSEMNTIDHRDLAEVLRACKGRVVLSGYPSALYEELYAGWRTLSFDIANHASGARRKLRKQEMLWFNW
jgi:DNA adenine methylase